MSPATAAELYLLVFAGNELVLNGDDLPSLDDVGGASALDGAIGIGAWRGRTVYAVALDQDPLPPGLRKIGLRTVFGELGAEIFAIASRAAQILIWDRENRFCGACGTETRRVEGTAARVCPNCGLRHYPRISPVIMVLIYRDREILLARNQRNPNGVFSAVAGFVEVGETLEETLVREVREEVGVEVRDIRYFGSQSWPFPHSLMIAFTAAYAGGTIEPDGEEIVEAAFFDIDTLPPTPPAGLSIASRLIRSVCERLRDGTLDAGAIDE